VDQTTLSTGATVGYTDSGGDGTVLVLSHGLLMNHAMFDAQVAALGDELRIVTWDQRGHGDAEHDGSWSYWDSARDLFALLDHLGVERAVLGGMSQGGFVSLRAALTAPERVLGLVLIDTQAGQEDPAVAPMYDAMTRAWAADGPDPATLDFAADTILGPNVDQAPWKALWAGMPWHRAPQVMHPLLHREDLTSRLGEISCQALVIHGTEDAAIPVQKAEALVSGLPSARPLVLVDGAGHAANMACPDQVNQAIAAFVGSL
jgi:3-oxoadipate enol-lactonase